MAHTTRSDSLADFRRGYLALLPLWSGAIPAGVAFGVAARSAGLSIAETQLMSLVVFSAAGQIGAVSLIAGGTSPLLLIGTVMALNAQLVLLGLAIGRQLRLSWPERLATAWLLTDGAYGVSLGVGPLRLAVLLGAGVSMYTGWNIGTALGAGVGAVLPGPGAFGIDLVAPLCFLAVLVPLVRSRPAVLVAVVAGLTALLLSRIAPGGVAVLGAGLVGCAVGAWATRGEEALAPHPPGQPPHAGEGEPEAGAMPPAGAMNRAPTGSATVGARFIAPDQPIAPDGARLVTGMVWIILGMGAGVYALRLVGLALRDVALPPTLRQAQVGAWERALRFVPVALLTGLVVVGLTGQVSAEPIRLVAVAGAAFVAHRTGKMWACILAGMVVYWLLGWLLP